MAMTVNKRNCPDEKIPLVKLEFHTPTDQIINVESHRLKGLGVGKCYSEYVPPGTAPEPVRSGTTPSATPGLSNSRTTIRQPTLPSPMSNCQSATPSRQQGDMERSIKSSQASAISQITKIYTARQKYSNNKEKAKDALENKILTIQTQRNPSHHPAYLHSPVLFSQAYHDNKTNGHHSNKHKGHPEGQDEEVKVKCEDEEEVKEEKHEYSSFQNMKNGYHLHHGEYNNSSSTPTVPYSTADILYGNEVNGGRGTSNEETRQNSFGESEKSKDMTRQRSKELELHPNNRRPSSKSGRQKSISIDSVTPFDKDGMDTLKNLSSALPPTKPTHHFRPNGIRSSMVKTESLYSSSKTNGANSGRDQDDLVAMGTLWSPNNNSDKPQQIGSSSGALSSSSSQQPPPGGSSGRNNSTSNTNTNSYPSKISSSSSVNNSMSSSNNTLNTQRKYPGNSVRPIVVQNNVSGKKNSNSTKEQEDPKYTDPLIGASASFQQRIIELGALEGDTVRWERTKRLKKKKADRDS